MSDKRYKVRSQTLQLSTYRTLEIHSIIDNTSGRLVEIASGIDSDMDLTFRDYNHAAAFAAALNLGDAKLKEEGE